MMGAERLAVASAAAISICLHLLWITTKLRSCKTPTPAKLFILALALSVYGVFLGGVAQYLRGNVSELEREEQPNVDGF